MLIEKDSNEKITLSKKDLERIKEDVKEETTFRITTLSKLTVLERKTDQMNGFVFQHSKDLASNRTAHKFFTWSMGIQFSVLLFILTCIFRAIIK